MYTRECIVRDVVAVFISFISNFFRIVPLFSTSISLLMMKFIFLFILFHLEYLFSLVLASAFRKNYEGLFELLRYFLYVCVRIYLVSLSIYSNYFYFSTTTHAALRIRFETIYACVRVERYVSDYIYTLKLEHCRLCISIYTQKVNRKRRSRKKERNMTNRIGEANV